MSEFQCYKFKTIDRPLTESERREVDALSSRGQVTSTSATFIYHYSDFRHDPEKVLEKYFDAMLYFSNWGTRRLMFRLPAKFTDAKAIRPYLYDDKWESKHINLLPKGEYYLLDFEYSDEEGGGWMEDDDFDLGDLAPLRDDILHGDYGALYLAWVKFSQTSDEEDEEEEGDEDDEEDEASQAQAPPPVPGNMKRMTAALKAFVNFFKIDGDLVAAAQAISPDKQPQVADYEKLLPQLSDDELLEWLARLLKGEARLDVQLKKRLEQFAPKSATPKLLTVSSAELKALTNEKGKERKAREAAEAEAAHVERMKKLAPQQEILWKSVGFNLERQTGKSYDLATEALKDLKDLAEYQGKSDAFRAKLMELRKEHFRRNAVISRWEKAGLFK